VTTVNAMTDSPRTVTVQDSEGYAPRMTLEIPGAWSEVSDAGPVLAAYSDDRSLSPAIASNVVLSALTLTEDLDLATWQGAVREVQMSTLPDLQVIDDRPVVGPDGTEQWYTSSVMTDQNGATVLTRRWNRVVRDRGITLTLTTVPMVDAQHADLFDAIAASWRVFDPAENGDSVDHP